MYYFNYYWALVMNAGFTLGNMAGSMVFLEKLF
jgi:hypothetical protein